MPLHAAKNMIDKDEYPQTAELESTCTTRHCRRTTAL